jgi:hypothetical protein
MIRKIYRGRAFPGSAPLGHANTQNRRLRQVLVCHADWAKKVASAGIGAHDRQSCFPCRLLVRQLDKYPERELSCGMMMFGLSISLSK